MQRLLAILCGLIGFCAANVLFARVLAPRPELRLPSGSPESLKIQDFRRNAARYDVVAIGTSRILRGFDPRVFDARTAELGHPVRSYNFGLVGMGLLEQRYLVDWILEQPDAHLGWMLLEATELDSALRLVGRDVERMHTFTMRSVFWHAPLETVRGVQATLEADQSFSRELEFLRTHVLHGLHRAANVGVAMNAFKLFATPEPELNQAMAGFVGRDRATNDPNAPEEHLNAEPVAAEPSPLHLRTLLELGECVRAAGVEPVYVLPPAQRPSPLGRSLIAAGQRVLVYDPETFPEIFTSTYFYDAGHLNLRGAELFTARLAQDFTALVAAEH